MTTTSVTTPPATPVTIENQLASDWKWVTQHLLALAIVVILVIGGVYFVENMVAKRDAADAAKYAAILNTQAQENSTLQKQIGVDEQQFSILQNQINAQQKQLDQAINSRNQQLAQQVKTDATLSAEQAAARLVEQTQSQPEDITAQGNNVVATLPVARGIVASLDALPVAQKNLVDTQTKLDDETKIATGAQTNLTNEQNLNNGLETQLADSAKSCNAQITAIKSEGRKGKLKAFFEGVGLALFGVAAHSL